MPPQELQSSIILALSEQTAIKLFLKGSPSNPAQYKLFNKDVCIVSTSCHSSAIKSKKIVGDRSQSSILKKYTTTDLLDMVDDAAYYFTAALQA